MITLTYNVHGKVRFWFGELPFKNVADYTVTKVEVDSMDRTKKQDLVIAVELMIPGGGRPFYGLLGAEYTFIPKEKLNVEINVATERKTTAWSKPLVRFDGVLKGILPEYAQGIIEGISMSNIPSGNIIFSCGAHGLVGSTTEIFRLLTRIIIAIIHSSYNEESVVELTELVTYYSKKLSEYPISIEEQNIFSPIPTHLRIRLIERLRLLVKYQGFRQWEKQYNLLSFLATQGLSKDDHVKQHKSWEDKSWEDKKIIERLVSFTPSSVMYEYGGPSDAVIFGCAQVLEIEGIQEYQAVVEAYWENEDWYFSEVIISTPVGGPSQPCPWMR